MAGFAGPEFCRKGVYLYGIDNVLAKYHDRDHAVCAMREMGWTHTWVRMYGQGYVGETYHTDLGTMKAVIGALKSAGLVVETMFGISALPGD